MATRMSIRIARCRFSTSIARRLEQVELLPFRAAIDAGVKSIMIGHLAVPALDDELVPVRRPGCGRESVRDDGVRGAAERDACRRRRRRRSIGELLRHELKFDGLVVSDAMDMGGITEHFDAGEAAIRAIEAGQDQILMSPNVDAAVAAVKAAVESGRLQRSADRRIGAAHSRRQSVRRRAGGNAGRDFSRHRHEGASRARRRASRGARSRSCASKRSAAGEEERARRHRHRQRFSGGRFAAARLRARDAEAADRTAADVPHRLAHDAEAGPIAAAAQNADVVIFALAVRARSGSGSIAVPEVARKLLADLAPRVPTIAISFGTPYLLREIPAAGTYICAYGIQPVMQVAAVHALFGEAPVSGKLPVTIPGLAMRGAGIMKP